MMWCRLHPHLLAHHRHHRHHRRHRHHLLFLGRLGQNLGRIRNHRGNTKTVKMRPKVIQTMIQCLPLAITAFPSLRLGSMTCAVLGLFII